jgi:hypothetical protein
MATERRFFGTKETAKAVGNLSMTHKGSIESSVCAWSSKHKNIESAGLGWVCSSPRSKTNNNN